MSDTSETVILDIEETRTKMGRPRKPGKILYVKIPDDLHKILNDTARALEMSLSDVARKVLLAGMDAVSTKRAVQ